MPIRPRPERDDALPNRDVVSRELSTSDAAARDAAPDGGPARRGGEDSRERIEVIAFRPPFRTTIAYVAPVLLAVGLVLFIPFVLGTPLGRSQLESMGLLPLAGSWLVMTVVIVLGAVLGLATVRALSSDLRRFARTEVLRMAVGDAVVAAAGATFAAALVSGGLNDMLRVLAIAFVCTFLFTWAMLLPVYRRAWDEAHHSRS